MMVIVPALRNYPVKDDVMSVPFLRSSFNYDRDAVSNETGLSCPEESLAIQSAEEESNINTIVRRFGISGELPGDVAMPRTGDFTGIPDFHTAMNLVRQAQEEFVRVPAEIRARFGNDPQAFMMFVEDEANREEARRLGLLRADASPAVSPGQAASGTPDAAAAS